MNDSRPAGQLASLFRRLDGERFHRYQELRGQAFTYEDFSVRFRHIQGSTGAFPASVCALKVDRDVLGLPGWAVESRPRTLATSDFLLRVFREAVSEHSRSNRGVNGSGSFQPLTLPQQVLERNLVQIDDDRVHVAFRVSLPGDDDPAILGSEAEEMFLGELPDIVEGIQESIRDRSRLRSYCCTVEDAEELANRLSEKGLVAFVADGARLPRRSGVSDRPAPEESVVPFRAPPDLATEVHLPNAGRVRGMGIPEGITVIVGGGFHGKSTLLNALAAGVYPHVPGDGREQVITRRDAVMVPSEDGRSICEVDISPFLRDLPDDTDPSRFSTSNASGSTSQAASIVEFLAAGAGLLLIDEDSSATNFLIRDHVMRDLVTDDPITPLLDRVRDLHEEHGVSTVIIVGGSSEYLHVADQVIHMKEYRPLDLTEAASDLPSHAPPAPGRSMSVGDARRLLPGNFDPSYTAERLDRTVDVRIKPLRGENRVLEYGDDQINLRALKGLVDPDQVLAIGRALLSARTELDEENSSPTELAEALDRMISEEGLGSLTRDDPLFLARPRRLEIAGAINRIRSLQVETVDEDERA